MQRKCSSDDRQRLRPTMRIQRGTTRRGAAAVEAAIVIPVFLFLFLALIIGGQMIAIHQRVACQAREATRWTSVRGGDYFRETGNASPTRQQILDQIVLPLSAGMEASRIELTVQW